MYVCMYECIYVCVYVCIYVCMYVCTLWSACKFYTSALCKLTKYYDRVCVLGVGVGGGQ